PGVSALASEIILDATKRIAAKKPLIVSMGNVAGSGGYYVACGSHAIFADPTTITASIGVLGGKLVTTGMWTKVGVTWHEYQRGQNAGINGTGSRYDDRERAKIKTYMKDIYEIFKGHVVACRGDKLTKPIGQIAGGRVFTGSQALELGLVDKLGGLNDAIKYAAAEAKVGDYEIRIIPRPKEPLEMLMEMMGQGPDDEDDVTTATPRPRLFAPGSPLFQAVLPMLQQLEPTRLGAMLRTLQRLELLQTESVLTMMPEEILIR
ncbi:MAG: S49 family peptidase, partial [Phycisphaerae bacterium]